MAWVKGKKYPQMTRKGSEKHFGKYLQKGFLEERNISGLNKGFFGKHTQQTKDLIRKKLTGKIYKSRGIPRPQIRGNKSSNWKGGITEINRLERGRFRETMQILVFERDNYTCQLCGKRGGDLQVDHIQSWAEYIELRFDINNCRTVCKKCHYEITFNRPMDIDKPWGHKLKDYQKGRIEK